jgi:hypothetical protein
MIDQATELRKLVLSTLRDGQGSGGPGPRLVVLTGGRAGVGVTSLGVNLSVSLSEQGLRVILVDDEGDDGRGVAALCGLTGSSVAADVGTARRDIHEALQRGPAGIQVVPGWRGGPSDAGNGTGFEESRTAPGTVHRGRDPGNDSRFRFDRRRLCPHEAGRFRR